MRTVNEMTWDQRCTADEDARDWAMEYGRSEFYYSEKWGQLTAVADGTTTLTEVADALAAGTATPYQEALAASYWADAADYLAVRALGEVAQARQGHPHEGLADDLGQVPRLVDDDELAAAEQRKAAADAALVEARQARDAAVAREDDARRWEEAECEAAGHEAGARAALEAEVAGPWQTAVDVEYDQVCAEYGNDGHPDNDRHISAEDKVAAIEEIAQRTGLAPGAVADAVRDVANAYGRSDGTDGADLGPPDWDAVRENWDQMMAQRQLTIHDGRAEVPVAERTLEGANAEAWGVPDGTPASVLPANLERWRAEGRAAAAERVSATSGEGLSAADLVWVVAGQSVDAILAEAGADGAGNPADEVLDELLADLDATPPDVYPGDDSAYWEAHADDIDPVMGGELAAAAVVEAHERYAEYDGGDSGELGRLDQAVMAADDALDQGTRVGTSGGDELPELAVQEYSVADDGADFECWADQAAGRDAPELDPDDGASPGKARAADAVATAHAAVQADTQRVAEELDAQGHTAHTANGAELTEAAEQAPARERGA